MEHGTYATMTRVYGGRTECAGCARTLSGNQILYEISDSGYFDGGYCRRCAGPLMLELVASFAGLDAPVALADPTRVARDTDCIADAQDVHNLLIAVHRGAEKIAREIGTRLGMAL